MPGPTKKFFGNLLTNGLKEAFAVESLKTEYNGQPQLKITAAQWEDGGISIDAWDSVNKKAIKLGNLRVSKLDNNSFSAPAAAKPAGDPDLPF